MKHLPLFSLVLLLFLAGCAIFRQQPQNTYFSFEFDDETYEILGFNTAEGESANFLVKREGEAIVFRAIDYNQDGFLERVIVGDMELDHANQIYQNGINHARETNRFKEINKYREFEYVLEEQRLVVQSYLRDQNRYINRFIIFNLRGSVIGIYLDDGSDGTLTRVEESEISPEEAQHLYERALQKAKEEERIERRFENRFIITSDEPIEGLRSNLHSE